MLEQYTTHYTTPAGIQHQHPLRLPTTARQVEHPLHLVGTVSCPYAVIGTQRGWRLEAGSPRRGVNERFKLKLRMKKCSTRRQLFPHFTNHPPCLPPPSCRLVVPNHRIAA
eukprot:scaffold46524_cov44-Cyclotella_meneghiniana.AAC.8